MTRVRSLLARGAYVDVPPSALAPSGASDPFRTQLDSALSALRAEMLTNINALTAQLNAARDGAQRNDVWIQAANDKAAQTQGQLTQFLFMTSLEKTIVELAEARQANADLMQTLDAERQSTAGMEERLVVTMGALINKALVFAAPPSSPRAPVQAPTYRMRVTARDANNRPTDIMLTPEAP